MIGLVLVNGLLDSINPCAIGVLLLYLALVSASNASRRKLFLFGWLYVATLFVVYFLIGLSILKVVHWFGLHNFFGWVAAVVLLLLGLFHLITNLWPSFKVPILSDWFGRCRIPKIPDHITALSAIAIGSAVGLCEFPCSGGIYLGTTALLAERTTFWSGVFYLAAYNLMFILPVAILVAISAHPKAVAAYKELHRNTARKTKILLALVMLSLAGILLWWLLRVYM